MSEPERGDVVSVEWVDIYEDPTGDPAEATLMRRTSYGLFWERREDNGMPVLITTTTLDREDSAQHGYCIYPAACVVKLRIVKRRRRVPKKGTIVPK